MTRAKPQPRVVEPDDDDDDVILQQFIAAHVLNHLIATCTPAEHIPELVVPPRLPGAGKRLRECDDRELAVIAILLRANIVPFRELMRERAVDD
jgi:hypothetical protein